MKKNLITNNCWFCVYKRQYFDAKSQCKECKVIGLSSTKSYITPGLPHSNFRLNLTKLMEFKCSLKEYNFIKYKSKTKYRSGIVCYTKTYLKA
jgi:hypothetical protein